MTQANLPDGVPPDNQTKASFSEGEFTAPDMATPAFARERPALDHKATRVVREEYEEIVEDDDDDDDETDYARARPRLDNTGTMAIIISIAALMAALGAIVIANARRDLPPCSSQPSWNQYNCRAG
ncbi:MAG: hypothetical protein ACX939_00555 [Hyphococcus sp.]